VIEMINLFQMMSSVQPTRGPLEKPNRALSDTVLPPSGTESSGAKHSSLAGVQISPDGDRLELSKQSLSQIQQDRKVEESPATQLSPEEQEQVEKLKQRDQEVRTHEQAHIAAGGPYVRGGASYTYQQGPDKKSYAIGGEVSIDASSTGEPEKDVEKARVVQAAALAPAEPSPQDLKVAAEAQQMGAQAAAELAEQRTQGDGAQGAAGDVRGGSYGYGAPRQSLGQQLDLSA
jgi:hypothetical protein